MSWEANDDYTVWTFKIRPGVRFHNGRELTAEDVKFSTERVMDPETASPYIGNFETVESIEVVDSHTMRLTLTAPNPRAEALFHVHVNAIMPPGGDRGHEQQPGRLRSVPSEGAPGG